MEKLSPEHLDTEQGTAGVVYVRMFGDFSITCGDECISNQKSRSLKVWLFLAYLLCNRKRKIPREELSRLLGDTEKNSGTGSALRMTRMRARRLLEPILPAVGQELMLGKDGSVTWNPEVPTELDTELFEELCRRGEEETDPDARVEIYRKAFALYRGDFLEKLSGEAWVRPLNVYYHRLYLDALQEALPLFHEAGYTEESVRFFETAVKFAPYEEELYVLQMRGLIAAEDYAAAENIYQSLYQLLANDLGVTPSEELQQLHLEALRHLDGNAVSPDRLRRILQEQTAPTGALVCDFNTFRLFYQAEVRSASRRGDAVHIGLFSVEGKGGGELRKQVLDRTMEHLGEQLRHSLRIGDIVATCSESQYVVLLVQANFEDSRMVCRRAIRAFEKAWPRSTAVVRSTVIPLETDFAEA